MTELIEVVKLIISSKVVPQTALIMMIPAILNAVASTVFDFLLLYFVIKHRRGITYFVHKILPWNGDHE